MKLVIEIEMDNAAFEGSGCAAEVARILHKCAARLLNDGNLSIQDDFKLRDINGNTCGTCAIVEN